MSVSWAATSYAYRGVGPPDDIIGHQDGALPLGHRHFSPTAVWQTNTDAFAIPTPRSPSPLDMFSYNNNIRSGREAAYGRSFRPQSALANLPNEIFSRIFVLCDDVSLLDAALVCRRWLVLSRRAFMTSYTIESANDFNRLLLLLQSTLTRRWQAPVPCPIEPADASTRMCPQVTCTGYCRRFLYSTLFALIGWAHATRL